MSDDPGVSFYNQDGIVIRAATLDDDRFVQLAFAFWDVRSSNDQMFITTAALHMVLTEDLGIDFVFSSHTQQRCVLRAAALDDALEDRLSAVVVDIREHHMGRLQRLVEQLVYADDSRGGALHTSDDPELEVHRVTDGVGQAFVEAFSREYRAAVS